MVPRAVSVDLFCARARDQGARVSSFDRKLRRKANKMSAPGYRTRAAVMLRKMASEMISSRRKDEPEFAWSDAEVIALVDMLADGIERGDAAG